MPGCLEQGGAGTVPGVGRCVGSRKPAMAMI